MIDQKTKNDLEEKLKLHAKALNLPLGSAEIFIKKSIAAAEKSFKNPKVVTKKDFIRSISKELIKYNSDLAYVFENYDKII